MTPLEEASEVHGGPGELPELGDAQDLEPDGAAVGVGVVAT